MPERHARGPFVASADFVDRMCNIRPRGALMGMESDLERDAAATSDAALVRYLRKWERSLQRLQAKHAPRWAVRGVSPEEVRDALTLRLLEVVRGPRDAFAAFDRPGKEWALCVMRARLSELRRAHRLRETPMELEGAPLVLRPPDQEELCMEVEAEALRAVARCRAEAQLSRPQRQWFAAMRMAASQGAFFASSDDLNLSAASRVLGKNRSSAVRAYREISATFERELAKVK